MRQAFAAAVVALLACVLASAASAQDVLRIEVSQGRTVQLPAVAASIFVADPEIADIQTPSAETVFVFGKTPGRTSLIALDEFGNELLSRTVVVVQAVDEIDAILRSRVGDYAYTVSAVADGILLTGTVPSPQIAERLVGIAEDLVGEGAEVSNRLTVAGQVQVKLRVRVAEVSRELFKELGVNWDAVGSSGNFAFGVATGRSAVDAAGEIVRSASGADSILGSFSDGAVDISAVIDALAEDNLASILAEPSLTALTGEEASFLAGGEYPIPVVGNEGSVTVDYRTFGVSLQFVPLVVSGNQISLKVAPEVSELSDVGSVEVNGFEIPAVRTRRASTTVDLASGQSFVIAGLLSSSFGSTVRKFPGLGDVPVLGALFRSTSFRRDESELIIIVTPYIVQPTARVEAQVLPTDLVSPPSDIERILFGALTGSRRMRWHGPAGFMVE